MTLVTGEEARAMGYNPDSMISIGGKYDIGGESTSSSDSIVSSSINEILKLIKPLAPYDQVNPFSFDEQLARQASTAEYAPYYQELLTNYVADAQKNISRSQEDAKKTLEQLSAGQEYYSGRERRVLDKAVDNTNRGYAGNNLFFSGAREKDVQDLNTEYDKAYGPEGYQTGQYLSNVDTTKTNLSRNVADINTAQSRYETQNQRDLQYGIETGVLNRKDEALKQYETQRKNYYNSQFGDYFG